MFVQAFASSVNYRERLQKQHHAIVPLLRVARRNLEMDYIRMLVLKALSQLALNSSQPMKYYFVKFDFIIQLKSRLNLLNCAQWMNCQHLFIRSDGRTTASALSAANFLLRQRISCGKSEGPTRRSPATRNRAAKTPRRLAA